MLADNCRLLFQLDTLVLLTNRSAKLIRKCCKSGNYGYHFSLYAMLRLCYNQKFRDNPKTSCSVIQPNDIKTSNKNFLECIIPLKQFSPSLLIQLAIIR